QGRAIVGLETLELRLVGGLDPTRRVKARALEAHVDIILRAHAVGEHVELQRPHHTDNPRRAEPRFEAARGPLFGELHQRLLEVFGAHGVYRPHRAQELWSEAWNPREVQRLDRKS